MTIRCSDTGNEPIPPTAASQFSSFWVSCPYQHALQGGWSLEYCLRLRPYRPLLLKKSSSKSGASSHFSVYSIYYLIRQKAVFKKWHALNIFNSHKFEGLGLRTHWNSHYSRLHPTFPTTTSHVTKRANYGETHIIAVVFSQIPRCRRLHEHHSKQCDDNICHPCDNLLLCPKMSGLTSQKIPPSASAMLAINSNFDTVNNAFNFMLTLIRSIQFRYSWRYWIIVPDLAEISAQSISGQAGLLPWISELIQRLLLNGAKSSFGDHCLIQSPRGSEKAVDAHHIFSFVLHHHIKSRNNW